MFLPMRSLWACLPVFCGFGPLRQTLKIQTPDRHCPCWDGFPFHGSVVQVLETRRPDSGAANGGAVKWHEALLGGK